MCYGNIDDAYKAVCRAPIGRSVHNVIHLLPKYRQRVRRDKPVEKRIQVWSKDKEDMLKDCFCTTNRDVFFDSCRDPHKLTDCILPLIFSFVKKQLLTLKWLKSSQIISHGSKDLKKLLNENNWAFHENNHECFKIKRKELRAMIHILNQKQKQKFILNIR